jgi:hypothetical protein
MQPLELAKFGVQEFAVSGGEGMKQPVRHQVGRSTQGSFDCAFPRFARERCAQDDSLKLNQRFATFEAALRGGGLADLGFELVAHFCG